MFNSTGRGRENLKAAFGEIKTGDFNLSRIAQYFLLFGDRESFQIVSDRTWQDLDLDEIFMFCDRTTSKVGQQYLYNAMRTVPATADRREKLNYLSVTFGENSALRDDALCELAALHDPAAYHVVSLFLTKHIPKPGWFWLIPVLAGGNVVAAGLTFFFPSFLILLTLSLAVSLMIHYWNKNNLNHYTVSIPQLLVMSRVARKLTEVEQLRGEREAEVDTAISSLTNLGASAFIFKVEAGLQGEFSALADYFLQLVKAFFLIEPLLLFGILKKLDLLRQEMRTVFDFVGEIDVGLSLCALRERVPHSCYAVVTSDSKQLSGEEIYHPMIPDFVANSLQTNGRSVLLTGSNMSGKTTFIRTLGVNGLLSQTVGLAFARSFSLSQLRIHSAVGMADNLFDDKSYYFEEVLTIKGMLEESQSETGNLFLLDELFRGTNTLERIAAGKAVLEYLDAGNNLVVVSTHDLELAEYLKDAYALYHFAEVIENDRITFDYKLKPGNLDTTNAIRILALNDYPPEVVAEALRLSEEIKSETKS